MFYFFFYAARGATCEFTFVLFDLRRNKKNPVPVKQKAGGGGLHRYVKIFKKKKKKLHFEHTRPYGNRTVTSKTFVL